MMISYEFKQTNCLVKKTWLNVKIIDTKHLISSNLNFKMLFLNIDVRNKPEYNANNASSVNS